MRRWTVIGGLLAFLLVAYYVQSIDHGGTAVDSTDPNDGDGDGWTDGYEFTYIGTAPMSKCEPVDSLPGRMGAWPPDFNNDRFVDITDLSAIVGRFGWAVDFWDPDSRRYDIGNEEFGDAVVDIVDVALVAGLFGSSC